MIFFSVDLIFCSCMILSVISISVAKGVEDRASVERSESVENQDEDDSGISVGLAQLIDPDDFPLTGLSPQEALDLLFQRYRARMMQSHEPRMSPMEDLSEKEIAEICGNSASLECGKKVLKYTDNGGEASNSPTVQRRCNLRKEFLDCIDGARKNCRRQSEKGIYPRLPPKSLIRSQQSKIWRALWTSGGCVLSN